jgi:hypothetical protein
MMLQLMLPFATPPMVLKNLFLSVIAAGLLGWSGVSGADEYRHDEYLGLDLSSASLSPKRLGPPAEFAPVPLEAKTDRGTEAAQASLKPKAEPKIVVRTTRIAPRNGGAVASVEPKARPKLVPRKTITAHAPVAKPRGAVATKLARRHGNPLDAQAADTRIQVWPCRSGGICDWKR